MATASRCPSCSATVRAGDPWCTLCWTDMRPKPAPAPAPQVPAQGAGYPAPAPGHAAPGHAALNGHAGPNGHAFPGQAGPNGHALPGQGAYPPGPAAPPAAYPPAPAAPPAPVALDGTPTAAAAAAALADPLTAPLAAVMGWPLAADPTAPSTATWPCVSCGAGNALELNVCGTCATPFGGRINRLDDVKAQRRKVLVISLGVVALFLMLLATVTLVGTKPPPRPAVPDTQTVIVGES